MKPALSLISLHTPGAVVMSAAGGHLMGTTVTSTGMENGTMHNCDLRELPGHLGDRNRSCCVVLGGDVQPHASGAMENGGEEVTQSGKGRKTSWRR